jgi:uncharacterized protein (TIGR03084 family)
VDLLDDLAAEQEALDTRVATLTPAQWATPTPAQGWTIADSVSHLTYFDRTAVLALTDPAAFEAHKAALLAGGGEPDVAMGRSEDPVVLRQEWRKGRRALLASARAADPATRVPWYGPAMALNSFVSARLMETWAHGTDVGDALGLAPLHSGRLRHVVHIGVRARPYAYLVHGVEDPGTPVAVVAETPDGELWEWGTPEPGGDELRGSALDLALVFTQRRHPDDTGIVATGATARQWLSIAQAYAGGPGAGRAPLTR